MTRSQLLIAVAVLVAACGRENPLTPSIDAGSTPLPTTVCLDNDGDGVPGTGNCAGVAVRDCDDDDPMTFPGAAELCNGHDDSCDGQLDEGLPVSAYYEDKDRDGVGAMKLGEGCRAPPAGAVTQAGDCNDDDATVRPGLAETCNGVDDDCDGARDNGLPFQDFFVDADGDGYGAASSAPISSCQTMVPGRVSNPGDCNDAEPSVKPGAPELCNKVDDNCDGQMDNGIAFINYFPDSDGDGFGDARAQA
ncbi:MAG: putative metal-binding motif-containing protein, partial [Myxococcota bacterium]